MLENIQEIIGQLNFFYAAIILINIFIFLSAWWIITFLDTSSLEKKRVWEAEQKQITKKVLFLRWVSGLMFGAYIFTLLINASFLNDIVTTLFIIIVTYLTNGWIFMKLLLFYWEETENNGEKYIRRWYKINMFSLILNTITVIVWLVAIFKVFEIDGLLQSWGMIAWILAFLGFTAPVWASDLVAGLSMLHHDEVEIWNVVHIPEDNLLAWVKNISLSEVKLIDLAMWHPIIYRPSNFRELKVENFSMWVAGKRSKIPQYIDAHIWYSSSLGDVEKIFFEAIDEMLSSIPVTSVERKYFPEKMERRVEIVEFWDYATMYRMYYELSSPFYIIKAQRLLNPFLQKYQQKYNIDFSTPRLVSLDKKI